MNPNLTPRVLRALTVAFILTVACPAQVSPGFRLFGPIFGTDTYLVDQNGAIVHTWPSQLLPGVAVYMLDDGSLLRTVKLSGFPVIGGAGGGLLKVALDGTVVWEFHYATAQHWSHHDVEPLPNGNVLMIAWQNKTVAEAIAAGRDPALIQGTVMRPDSIIEVQPTGPFTGTVVWEWHVWDHLIQDFDPARANFGAVAAHPELLDVNYPADPSGFSDWNHMNSVKYDAVHDRILMSARSQNEVWVIDHSTTTAEAAGHTGGASGRGGDFLYRYGNPAAYRAGTAANQVFFGQHCFRVIPPGYPGAGNFTVFNNNAPGGSTVWEFTPPLDASGNFVMAPGGVWGPSGPVWTFSHGAMSSSFISSAERMPNGNTLICSGGQGAVAEVTPAGAITWSHLLAGQTIFHAHYVERSLWSDRTALSGASGGTATFDVIAGSPYAGTIYLLLASMSGIQPGMVSNGITVPLNFDSIVQFSFDHANSPILKNTFGNLDGSGRATATLILPPIQVVFPALLHFAAVVVDPATLSLAGATNAVPLTILP